MPYLMILSVSRCRYCHAPANVELFDNDHLPLGRYCNAHGEQALRTYAEREPIADAAGARP